MSNPKDKGEIFTDLEEALRGVHGVKAILQKLVELSNNADTPIYDVLASHLDSSYQRAYRAFCDLHDLVIGPEVIDQGSDGGEP